MTPEEKARYVELLKRKKALLEAQQPKAEPSLVDRAVSLGKDAVQNQLGQLDVAQNLSNEALDYYLSGNHPSPLAYPGARLFQAVNPLLWGEVGEQTFEKHPEAVRSNEDLIEALRRQKVAEAGPLAPAVDRLLPSTDTLQAAETFGAQQLPQLPFLAEGMLKAGVGEAAQMGGPAANILYKLGKGAATGTAFGAGGGFLGAAPGKRAEGALHGGTDLTNILLGALPEAGGQAFHEVMSARSQVAKARALSLQNESVTAVGNPALRRDPLLPPEFESAYSAPERTSPGSRAPTQVVRSPRPADPLLPPEPSTMPYLDSGGMDVDTLRAMTDAERAGYVTETADQMSRKITDSQARADTKVSDVASQMRRSSLEEAPLTQTYERDEMGTNPGRPSSMSNPRARMPDPVDQLPSSTLSDRTVIENTALTPGYKAKRSRSEGKTVSYPHAGEDLNAVTEVRNRSAERSVDKVEYDRAHMMTKHEPNPVLAAQMAEDARLAEGGRFSRLLDPKTEAALIAEQGGLGPVGYGPQERARLARIVENRIDRRTIGERDTGLQQVGFDVTHPMQEGDAARIGLGPGGSAFEGPLAEKMRQQRSALRSGDNEKTFVEGQPAAIVKRGDVRGTMPEREMGPYGKFSDELGNAIAGKPEPVTQISKRKTPTGQAAPAELPPEPRTVFASKEQLVNAEAKAILARQLVKKDPRTMQAPNKVPVVDLPPAVQPQAPMERDARWVQKRLAQSDSYIDKLVKFASLPEQRAVPIVASAIRGWESAKRMQDVMMAKVFPILRNSLKKMGPAQAKLVEKYIAQNVSPERVLKEGHTFLSDDVLPPEFRALYDDAMKQNRKYRDDLIAAGLFSKEQVAKMEQMDQLGLNWLHRDFQRYMDSAFIPRHDKLARAIDWVSEHGKMTRDEASAHVVELLGSYGEGNPQQRWSTSRLNKEILQGREQIPSILRDLMGEIHNPAFVTAASMSEIERMWRQYKVSETYTSPEYKGIVWDDKPSPGMYETPIADDKRMYGQFAGKYVAPELFEAVKMAPAPKLQNAMARTFSWISTMFKTSKVALSPITFMVNGLSNLTNMAAAGLPVWHPNTYARTAQAFRAYSEFGDTFLTDRKTQPIGPRDGQWMQWMLEDGAHRPGLGAESAGSEAKAIAKRYLREKRGDYLDVLSDTWHMLGEKRANLGAIYDMMDAVPRLATYIEQVTQGVQKGMDLRTARTRAARIINENFVSSGNVGHGVRDVARYTGMVNPFMSWHADNIRVHVNWIRNGYLDLAKLAKGQKTGLGEGLRSGTGSAQALNVGLQYGLIAGAFGFMRMLNGVTDQELQAAESMIKEGYKKYNPLLQYIPGRDERGRPRILNLTPIIPSSVFIRGLKTNPDPGDLMSRVMLNSVGGFFQGSLGENTVNNSMAAFGLGEQDMNADPILPGQEGWKGLRMAYDFLKPGIVQNAEDLARRTQISQALANSPLAPIIPDRAMVPGRYEEPWTPGQAIWNTVPLTGAFKVQPIGETSAAGERLRKVAQESQLRQNIGKTKKLPVLPGERERLRGTTREAVGRVRSGG